MSDLRKFTVTVTQTVEVELDAACFDAEFMEEFRRGFFKFDTLEEHAGHIGQLFARGIIELGWDRTDFIEGYGHAHEMGIRAREAAFEKEVEPSQVPA